MDCTKMVDTQKTFQNKSFQLLFRCHLMHFDFFELKIKSLFILTEKIKKKNLLCINIRTKAPNVSFRIPAIKIHTRKCCPLQNYVDKMPAKQKEKGVRH